MGKIFQIDGYLFCFFCHIKNSTNNLDIIEITKPKMFSKDLCFFNSKTKDYESKQRYLLMI